MASTVERRSASAVAAALEGCQEGETLQEGGIPAMPVACAAAWAMPPARPAWSS